jgi:C4-dicarboxylate-specific signal transduction histidine kinase
LHTELETKTETVKWKFHPRVFAALGSELVTNDLVALVELVKNAYDAMATRCDIRFVTSDSQGPSIVIQDDGIGMNRETLLNDWFTIGTPRKLLEQTVASGGARRRVTGEKGLGRLSAARLGDRLRLTTKSTSGPCYRADLDWRTFTAATDLGDCAVSLSRVKPPPTLGAHGTILEVFDLRHHWRDDATDEIGDLKTELARFASPFSRQRGFAVYLTRDGVASRVDKVKPAPILLQPDYVIAGDVDRKGVATLTYRCKRGAASRQVTGRSYLVEDSPSLVGEKEFDYDPEWSDSECGPFRFELRLWDLEKDSLFDHADRLGLDRKIAVLRKQISDSPFSCVSLYRDGVLVLPKALARKQVEKDAGRDWLGLNARRVSRVGTRINANMLVGFVEISADRNPRLSDASDRERLVDSEASRQFRKFLLAVIGMLERERDRDRTKPGYTELPMKDLLEAIRSPGLQQKFDELEKRGGGWKEIREAVEEHDRGLKDTAEQIEKRFYYYSRLATIGSLAALLQHEVGSKVSVLGEFLTRLRELDAGMLPKAISRRVEPVSLAVRSLERLADKFAPLATRQSATRRRNCVLETEFDDICELRSGDVERLGVDVKMRSPGRSTVAVDPGEIAGILDNLLTNSLYWLSKVDAGSRNVVVEVHRRKDGGRVDIRFHDSGPGIADGDEERIFWPGVTNKETGLGMGLTVASEIVASHGGNMYLIKPGDLGGASFGFDLPLAGRA